jgi:polysaccharide biosynthesis/export protein
MTQGSRMGRRDFGTLAGSALKGAIVGLAAIGWFLAVSVIHAQSPAAPAPTRADYVIAVQDVLNVTVWEHEDLDGKFTVQPDGTITLPLVGRLAAAGLTVREFETQLARALAEGFIREPRVAVTFDQIRGRRVFVFGNVAAPGTYPLTEGQTLIEALAKAGYGVASEAVVVRPKHPSGPKLPEHANEGEVLRVNLRELEKDVQQGSLGRNVVLQDGDTVFVPRDDPTRVFVTGRVRNPGAYSIAEGTTVLQALALAGGATEEAAVNRPRILRIVGGKQQSIKVKLSDPIHAGDTLVIPERFF